MIFNIIYKFRNNRKLPTVAIKFDNDLFSNESEQLDFKGSQEAGVNSKVKDYYIAECK